MAGIPVGQRLGKIDAFLAHWGLANAAAGSPIILTGNYAVAGLTADRPNLARHADRRRWRPPRTACREPRSSATSCAAP